MKIILSMLLTAGILFPVFSVAQTAEDEKNALEAELAELEEQIAQYEQDISKTASEKKTLQNEIYVLKKTISKLNAQISQSNIMIESLENQIGETEESIDETGLKIDDSKVQLAGILRSIHEQDQVSMLEVLLTEDNLSGFFEDLAALDTLNEKSSELLANIKSLKVSLENQKASLDGEKDELEKVVALKTYQKNQSQTAQATKDQYLKITEAEYQQQLKEKNEAEQKAAEIRARIFELAGDTLAPTFGEALEIAKYVESVTGVRPAFLLAVMTQESNLGKNVGQCYVRNTQTGSGIVIKTGASASKVMSPSRDIPPFLDITEELGKDPYNTPVSCPMSYGWGGAMGPAQFIPATWQNYRERIEEILGRAANPWAIKDSFLAAGLYLSDYGAKSQAYNGELNAALSYFAGPGWSKSSYASVYKRDYGYPIMNITSQYAEDIAKLE
ncbi:MAG: lytic murein transglycosylase [Candidatus Paceibacterota bacterium]